MNKTVSLLSLAVAMAVTGCGNKDKDKADPAPAPGPTPTTPGPTPTTPGPTPTTPGPTPTTPGPTPTTPGPTPTTPGPTPTTPAANTPHTTDHPTKTTTAVFEGAACTAGLQPVTDVAISVEGPALRFTRSRGGGCPTRAVYTAFYVKGDPVAVRVCVDPGADLCEMMIQDERVVIDLGPALAASGATTAVLAK